MFQRKIVNLMFLLLITTAMSVAAHGRGQRISLNGQLGLSDEQQVQVEELRASFGEASQALHTTYKTDINAVYTDEQLAAIEAYKAERMENRRAPRPDLALSDEQVAAFGAMRTAYKEARSTLNEEHRAAFEAVLNGEQLTLLGEIKSTRLSFGGHGNCNKDGDVDAGADGDTDEETETTEATFQALPNSATAATAVEAMSWGRIKGSFSK